MMEHVLREDLVTFHADRIVGTANQRIKVHQCVDVLEEEKKKVLWGGGFYDIIKERLARQRDEGLEDMDEDIMDAGEDGEEEEDYEWGWDGDIVGDEDEVGDSTSDDNKGSEVDGEELDDDW